MVAASTQPPKHLRPVPSLTPHIPVPSARKRRKRAATGVRFSEEQVWTVFLQVAAGLQYLHHNHVLHRDLKPGNLLLTDRGVVKIADLGISQVLDRVFTNAMTGTPHYMAPEMWRRKPYSYSADIWALGCILHELCTLKPLFLAPSDEDTCRKVLAGNVPPISGRYSDDLSMLIAAMLQQNPADRPTIDDILQLPAAQPHLARLPVELQERALSPALANQARILEPIRLPRHSHEWDDINQLLPEPRYSSGTSVSGALRGKQKSWSTGDLQALAAAAGANADEPPEAASATAGLSAGSEAALAHRPAAAQAAAMRKSQSHGALAAAVEARLQQSNMGLLRRRSLSVGEQLQLPLIAGVGGILVAPSSSFSRHRRSRPHNAPELGSVAEEAAGSPLRSSPPSVTRPAGAAIRPACLVGSRAEEGLGDEAADGRRMRSYRSRSLSVEDAIDVVTAPQPPLLPACPTSQRHLTPPPASQVMSMAGYGAGPPVLAGSIMGSPPIPLAAAGAGAGSPAALTAAGAALVRLPPSGSPALATHSPAALQARPPLPSAPVTAQVRAASPEEGSKVAPQQEPAAAPAARLAGEAPANSRKIGQEEDGKPKKKKGFLWPLKGGKK